MKVLFHHIPKTAGTSLIEHAQAHWGEAVCNGRYDDEVAEAQIVDERLVFYHGHFTRGFVLRFRELVPDALIFTFVRHPINRLLSQFYNWTDRARVEREFAVIDAGRGDKERLRRIRNKFESKILGLTLESFLRSRDPDLLQGTDNLQCQYMVLAGSRPHHLRFMDAPVNAVGFYDFIGMQELYAPCLRILESKCELPAGTLGGVHRTNASDYARIGGRYHVTAREMALLERRSTYDLVLFHVAHVQLLKLYGDFLPEGAADIAALAALPDVTARSASLPPVLPSVANLPKATRV